ncbi:hypothetical protein ACQEVC_34330 [Plantactinospora sp. CA-294935]|uniref:hypothetical protein n=1 Tax=Plantactinospora sp. CA-294935 TaxID=3240012 RepID=UPI003D94EA71
MTGAQPEEPTTTVPDFTSLHPSNDRYLLRNLLWCHACDVPMAPSQAPSFLGAPRPRTYHCPHGCRETILRAEIVEERAIAAAGERATIRDVAPLFMQSALELLIRQVRVASNDSDLVFHWRT